MRIALVASPFISVPPATYGGTELFIAQLAEGLTRLGIEVVVYANGESQVGTEVRWLYERGEWPIAGEIYADLKDLNHTAWAVRDAWDNADVIHMNNVSGLAFSRFPGPEFVCTLHHKHEPSLSSFYEYYPHVQYVSISNFQKSQETMPRIRAIHHGVDMGQYRLSTQNREHLSFLGRLAPIKGVHTAIAVAKKTGIPLKIAGEIQPLYRDYYESEVKPHVDGKFIEYIGEVDLEGKNELLGKSVSMLFPIEWDEPFGLVMIEAMATGTPVVAFPGGAVEEVVKEGLSGNVCRSVDQMVDRVRELPGRFSPEGVRAYAERHFSVERMVREYAELYRDLLRSREERLLPLGAFPGAELKSLRASAAEGAEGDDQDGITEEPEEPRAIA